jgi:hypothetical protein
LNVGNDYILIDIQYNIYNLYNTHTYIYVYTHVFTYIQYTLCKDI